MNDCFAQGAAAARGKAICASAMDAVRHPGSVSTVKLQNPFVLRVGQVMTGFGLGCGLGVGVGIPIPIGRDLQIYLELLK